MYKCKTYILSTFHLDHTIGQLGVYIHKSKSKQWMVINKDRYRYLKIACEFLRWEIGGQLNLSYPKSMDCVCCNAANIDVW